MGVRGIDHINISTDKLAETVQFFIDVLGLTEGSRPAFPFPGAWLYSGDQAVVHLVGKEKAKAASREAALDHFAFRIDDYAGAIARLDRLGIGYTAAGVPGRLTQQLFLLDPNGVTIELNYPGDLA